MTCRNHCRTKERRRPGERGLPGDHELRRTLDEYEGFIRYKSQAYAWRNYGDKKDFEQVGRQAVVQLFRSMEDRIGIRNEKGYYFKSIQNAMLDYYRKEYRCNYEVWVYDKKNGPTRVKRYRYRGQWKARIQYHGDRLKRVALKRQRTLQFQDHLSEQG